MTIYITSLDSSLVNELTMTRPGGVAEAEGVAPRQTGRPQAVPFANVLQEVVDSANTSINQADQMTTAFSRGEQNDLHGTMLALNQAHIRLSLVNETRNKLLEAYREVMRMSV